MENTNPPNTAPRMIARLPAPIIATNKPASEPIAIPTNATASIFSIYCYA